MTDVKLATLRLHPSYGCPVFRLGFIAKLARIRNPMPPGPAPALAHGQTRDGPIQPRTTAKRAPM